MRPAPATLATVPYKCNDPGFRKPDLLRGEHYMYNTYNVRCNLRTQPLPGGLTQLIGTRSTGGNAVWLPYCQGKITSVKLPAPSEARLLGIDFFVTDNMSGCKFFVDTEGTSPTSQKLVVYHANKIEPGSGAPNRLPSIQGRTVTAQLNNLHTQARTDYQATTLNTKTSLAKPRYNQAADALLRGKINRVRNRRKILKMSVRNREVYFVGGTTIFGYPESGGWKFYWQTWGYAEYLRPNEARDVLTGLVTFHWKYVHKLRTRGNKERLSEMAVIARGQF